MPRKKAVTVTPPQPANPALVKTRTEGLTILSPLKHLVDSLAIETAEDYIEADSRLNRIRNARALWATKINPIRGPFDRIIDEAKAGLKSIKELDAEVDGPMEVLERKVRDAMKAYKLEEAREIEAENTRKRLESEQLRKEADERQAQADSARTVGLKARLEQARADLEQQAAVVEASVAVPVQAGSSSAHFVQKIRIKDPQAFLSAMKDYKPMAGVFKLKTPPMSLLTHRTKRDGTPVEDDSALAVLTTEVSKLWSVQPGVVESWPGVEVYDDAVIAAH